MPLESGSSQLGSPSYPTASDSRLHNGHKVVILSVQPPFHVRCMGIRWLLLQFPDLQNLIVGHCRAREAHGANSATDQRRITKIHHDVYVPRDLRSQDRTAYETP